MKKGLTSIIFTAYVQTQFQAHMTMATLANITRYTDTEDYELILMSDSEKQAIRDDYKNLKIDQKINTEAMSYTACMNLGASKANGEFLVFIQNDVFVWEDWLPDLRYYLENGLTDCIIPDQMPRDRAFVKSVDSMSMEEAMKYGSRDEGLWMMTKEGFDRFGGFDETLSLLHARDFYTRFNAAGLRINDTCKVMISHIMAATNRWKLEERPAEYEAEMKKDADKLNK